MDIGLGRNPEPLASLWSCCGEIGMDLCPWFKQDNVSDHRAATSDSAIEKRPGFAAPVHRIAIPLTDATTLRSSFGLPTLAFMALIAVRFSNWIWVQELQQREISSFY